MLTSIVHVDVCNVIRTTDANRNVPIESIIFQTMDQFGFDSMCGTFLYMLAIVQPR